MFEVEEPETLPTPPSDGQSPNAGGGYYGVASSEYLDYVLERLPVDLRIVEEIERSSAMRREQGSGFLQRWGGPSKYAYYARMPELEKRLLEALFDGWCTLDALTNVLNVSRREASVALESLKRKGLVKTVEI